MLALAKQWKGGGVGVPRPLGNSFWFKLLGPGGWAGSSEFRDAILAGRVGEWLADAGIMVNVRALISAQLHDLQDRRGIGESPVPGSVDSHASFLLNLRFPIIPDPDAHANGAGSATDGVSALTGGVGDPADRMISLQAGLDPLLGDNPLLLTCDGWEQPGTRNGYAGGWLEGIVRSYEPQQRGLPGFEFHHVAPGDLESWTSMTGPVDARIDTMALSGDFSSGFILTHMNAAITELLLCDDHDYSLITHDDFVGAGARLTIHGERLAFGGHVMFDGSAETDGSFSFLGSENNDFFFGGAGDDLVRGGGGADTLTGRGGHDTFVYTAASDSTGPGYDTLADFDPKQDRIDLPGTVTGLNLPIESGTLSTASFNADLGAALSHLGVGYAAFYAPDAGDLAGNVFLVVDANGVAGYQAGEDYVFALPATTLADLSAHPNFFI